MKGFIKESFPRGGLAWTCEECYAAFTDKERAKEHLSKGECMGASHSAAAWGGPPKRTSTTVTAPAPAPKTNEVWFTPDGSGLICECGASWPAGYAGQAAAQEHMNRGCTLPKTIDPGTGTVLASSASVQDEQLDMLKAEMEDALSAARMEGVGAGYFNGLIVARDALNQIVAASERWGHAERAATEMCVAEIDELIELARRSM